MSTPSIRYLINCMRWDDALSRIASHPEEASYRSYLGETALSTACRMKAPSALIAALLAAHPSSALLRHAGGKTPLHLSCSDLRRTSRGENFEDDAEIIRSLVEACPESVSTRDDDGWLPLHHACSSGPGTGLSAAAPLSVLQMLVESNPLTVLSCNRGGVTPLSMLWDRTALNEEDGRCILSAEAARFHARVGGNDRICGAAASASGVAAASDEIYYRRTVRPRNNSAAVWSKVLLMVRAVSLGTESSAVFRPLHALAGIDCPSSMVEFALRVHGDDNEHGVKIPDEDGNLPLHLASSRRGGTAASNEPSSKGAAIELLLGAYPQAARTRNAKGRLPLDLAVESGCGGWNDGGICTLFRAAPAALGERDPVTGLYPFMTAALAGSTDVCYRLLKSNPGVLVGEL